MRSPSAKVLINRIDVYAGILNVDDAGGVSWTYPGIPAMSQVPCTIQAGTYIEVVDDQERISRYVEYKIMFDGFQPVTPRDKLVYVDGGGLSHTLFVQNERDEAGRGAAFTVHAVERL